MKREVFLSLCALALAACGQSAQAPQAQVSPAGECPAQASSTWNGLNIEAVSAGPDCALATATITIRDGAGLTLWTQDYPTARVMVLADASTPEAMQNALGEWINMPNTTIPTTAALPEWPQGAPTPQNGEFPFYPEEGVDRASYNALRGRDAPLYCYVQGMESLACLAFERGALAKVGAQSFPG